jgi:hypothetical protein
MKRVIHRIQALGDKAAQLKHAVEGAPAVAAGIRDAVAVTAGQLRQLRADVQAGVSGLRVEDEDRLLEALREVSAGNDVFERAGFGVSGVDVELGLLRRIIVRLEKLEEVSLSQLRSIHASSTGRPTLQALLNALIKAEEMAAKVVLPDLTYRELIVDVGPAPTVRVCWRPDTVALDPAPAIARPASAATTTAPPLPTSSSSIFGRGSFFEPRPATSSPAAQPAASSLEPATVAAATMPGPAGPTQTASVPAGAPAPVPVTTGVTTKTGDWKRGALDRFKRMPDLSKTRH